MKPIKNGTKFIFDGAEFTTANSVVSGTYPNKMTVTLERDIAQPIGGTFRLVSGRKRSIPIKVKQETKKP